MRLGARGTVAPGWDYKLETEVQTGQKIRVTEGYIAYTGLRNTQIQIGNLFEMYGLEEYASAVDVTFMERSAAIDTFAPDYNQGIAVTRWGGNWSLGAGIYGDTANNAQAKLNESWGSSVRLVFAPPPRTRRHRLPWFQRLLARQDRQHRDFQRTTGLACHRPQAGRHRRDCER